LGQAQTVLAAHLILAAVVVLEVHLVVLALQVFRVYLVILAVVEAVQDVLLLL
jgi:hypothetical protein